MKILSIDYDYFQKVSIDTLKSHYPDGVDLPTHVTEITWADHYVNPCSAEPLKEVTVNQEELELMEDILLNQRSDLPVMIANSHVHIYDFIHEHCKVGDDHMLCNVDMHHDMFNDNPKLDCGNWINHIIKDYGERNVHLRWISNPVSSEVFGLENIADATHKGYELLPTSVSDIYDMKFDLVFLCRSDTWTPPHLDKGFDELVDTMKSHYERIQIEKCVTHPRDLQPLIEELKLFYEDFFKNRKNQKAFVKE